MPPNVSGGVNLSDSMSQETIEFWKKNQENCKNIIKAWWKFNICCINQLLLIRTNKFTNDSIKSVLTDLKDDKIERLLAFIVANDGYLRIIDLTNDRPIFLWKYEGSGLNSICINKNENLIAMGTQDDSIVLMNLENLCTAKFEIHKSFVTQLGFMDIFNYGKAQKIDIPKGVQRIMAGSMDGTFSIIDIDMYKFKWTKELPKFEKLRYKIETKNGKYSVKNHSVFIYID